MNLELKLHAIGQEGDGFTTTKDLMTAIEAVRDKVDAYTETYDQVNVDETMKHLVHAGSLLRVAYAAAGDSKAAPLILELFSKHHSLLGDCVTMTASFVQGCLGSLEHHFDALDALLEEDGTNNEKKAKAIRALALCAAIATTMAEDANEVVVKATDMELKSEQALVAAKESKAKTVAEKKDIQRMHDEASSRKKRREAQINELNECIKELNDKETKFENKADREAVQANKMMLLKVVIGAVATLAGGPMTALLNSHDLFSDPGTTKSNGQPDISAQERETSNSRLAKETSESLRAKEAVVKRLECEIKTLEEQGESDENKKKIDQAKKEMKEAKAELDRLQEVLSKTKSELDNIASRHFAAAESNAAKASVAAAQKAAMLTERREAAGDLAAAAEDLKNLSVERDELVKAIKALEVCVTLMGQIKSTFTKVRIFWEAIAKMCSDLRNYDEQRMKDKNIKKLRKYVENQMVKWIGLGRLNYNANCSIKQAFALVNENMKSLPTSEETQKILEVEAKEIAKMLEAECEMNKNQIVMLDLEAA